MTYKLFKICQNNFISFPQPDRASWGPKMLKSCCILNPINRAQLVLCSLYSCRLRVTMPGSHRKMEYSLRTWFVISVRRQLYRARPERNKVQKPSMYTNLVRGNWLLLVTRRGPGTKSSGFSIKQCQILMIFLFPATRMNSLILSVVLMNVCYCLLFLLSFSPSFLEGMQQATEITINIT